ncbi:MAG TPA: hypothetical protein VN622_10900 [Clostridia bacterium]|nr:hypothetical protein [Clostridia bacterium]
MIPVPANFTTANAKLAKTPVYLVEIEDYPHAFVNQNVQFDDNDIAIDPDYVADPYPLPFAIPAGQSVAWAFPTAVEVRPGDEGAANGLATATLSSAHLRMTSSHPLGNLFWAAQWSGFVMPTLPVGAVIEGVYAVLKAQGIRDGAFHTGASSPALNLWSFSASNDFLPEPTSGNYDGTYHSGNQGSSVATVAGLKIGVSLNASLSQASILDEMFVDFVGLAIYYSGAGSGHPGGTYPESAYPARSLRPWMNAPDDLTISINPLDGSSSLGELTFEVADYMHLLTADFPGFVFEGKRVRLRTGFLGMKRVDYALLFTGKVDSVNSSSNNTAYTFVCSGGIDALHDVVYTEGDDGQPTDSDHPRTLNGNPLDIMLSILRVELGLPEQRIHAARIEAYRDQLFAGVQFAFTLDSAPEAREFIQSQLLKPLGGYLLDDYLGRITVNFLYPLPEELEPSMDLDNKLLVGIPAPMQADMVNTVCFRFDKNEEKYRAEVIEVYGRSRDVYGQAGDVKVIESDGMRSGFQGYFIAALTARMIFLRFGMKNLQLENEALWNACPLSAGDIARVTHPLIPDRVHGTFGIANWQLQVLDKTYNFREAKVSLKLIDVSAITGFGRFRIAPDTQVDWPDATPAERSRYLFLSDNGGLQSDGSPANTLG